MRRAFSIVLIVAFGVACMPAGVLAAGKTVARQQAGTINGVAQGADKQPLPRYTVRIRNTTTGQLAGSTTSTETGAFTFTGLEPANYVVEVVDAAGNVVGVSPAIAVTAGAAVSVTVTASAAGLAGAAAGGGAGLFGLGTAATVGIISAAGALTIVGVVAATNNASPSR
jgi:hypothetical protein